MGLHADLRAAAVNLLISYSASAGVKLQWYPGRPRSINPPTGFVDTMSERRTYTGSELVQRYPVANVVVVWGLFDSKEAVTQRDAFVDGFLDEWHQHQDEAGSNTVSDIASVDDLPAYVPDWLPERTVFYATQISVEGYAG